METRAAARASEPSGQRTRMTLPLRAAVPADVPTIAAIYGEQVATGTSSFEYDRPSVAEMTRRYEASVTAGFPWFVAEDDAEGVVGYTFASPYRPRPGYRYTVEDSVYVRRDRCGQGVGRALLDELVRLAGAHGFHAIIARIVGGHEASIALHEVCGFELVGVEREVGRKFGRWLDVVELERLV